MQYNSGHLDLLFLMATVSHLIRDASSGLVIFWWFSDPWRSWIVMWHSPQRPTIVKNLNLKNYGRESIWFGSDWVYFEKKKKNGGKCTQLSTFRCLKITKKKFWLTNPTFQKIQYEDNPTIWLIFFFGLSRLKVRSYYTAIALWCRYIDNFLP